MSTVNPHLNTDILVQHSEVLMQIVIKGGAHSKAAITQKVIKNNLIMISLISKTSHKRSTPSLFSSS